MAHLLGNKFCIESLQKDVGDLQSVVIDIFSRTGSVTAPSWKYPEKLSCDLDINDLLDRYCYSDDEEDCQVSHVILLELVIDRLVLVTQAFSSYTEQMLKMGKSASVASNSSNSIGLSLKRYWNKMIQLHSVVKKLQSDNRGKSNQGTEPQDVSACVSSEHHPSLDSISEISEVEPLIRKLPKSPISSDYSCKSTQTYETAFIPCEACDGAQFCLKEAAKSIAEMCKSQSMNSYVLKVYQNYQNNWMSVHDMRIWLAEQNKDLEALTQQIANLTAKLKDTEERFDNSQVQNNKYRSEIQTLKKDLKTQKEDMTVTRKQYEKKLQDLREKSSKELAEAERRIETLTKNEESLQVRVADLRCQLEQKGKVVETLESSQKKVLNDLVKSKTDQHELKKSQKYVEILEKELKDLHSKLEDSSRIAASLEVKGQSTNKQLAALKAKQAQLFDQIETLEQENDSLKQELADIEIEKEELAETLDTTNNLLTNAHDDRSDYKSKLENLKREKAELSTRVSNLEESVLNLELQIQKAKEQERLLVEYPDLNGPINCEGTGDVATDMENQIRANSARIHILQEENDNLIKSVRKILRSVTRNESRSDVTNNSNVMKNELPNNQRKPNNIPDLAGMPKLQLWR